MTKRSVNQPKSEETGGWDGRQTIRLFADALNKLHEHLIL